MDNYLLTLWEEVLDRLQKEVTRATFETWLKPSLPAKLEGTTLFVGVPHELARNLVAEKYGLRVREVLSEVAKAQLDVKFIVTEPQGSPPLETNEAGNPRSQGETRPTSDEVCSTPLNPKYTFDTFVVGNSNRFAHAASLAVAEAPGKAYNPLFIYGGVGLGKTHLMQAIGHLVLSQRNPIKVVYVSSEKFTNDLINAIRDDTTDDFRDKYRNIDVLLVDDIQFLAGKERTQEEFFHTFNTLYEAGKQIVISSDRPPKEIPTLEDRLRSRFEWGLITDIQAPDLETRIAILKKKASIEGVTLPNDVLVFIANQIHSNIRELEGALIRVIAYSSLNPGPLTVQTASEILRDILPSSRQKQISIPLIQQTVADFFHITQEEMTAKKRSRNVAFPRQIAMYLARELTEASLPKIGESFGGRDHTTVIHACEKIQTSMKEDSNLASLIKQLIARLQNSPF